MVSMTTIEKINVLLSQNGMSGADLERALGLSNSVYSQWNTGTTKPSKKNLKRIADLFNIDVEELLPDPQKTKIKGKETSPEKFVHNTIMSASEKIPATVTDDEDLEDTVESAKKAYFNSLFDRASPEIRDKVIGFLLQELQNQ